MTRYRARKGPSTSSTWTAAYFGAGADADVFDAALLVVFVPELPELSSERFPDLLADAACSLSFLLALWWPIAQPAAAPTTPCLPATWPATPPTAAPLRHPLAFATPVVDARAATTVRASKLSFMNAILYQSGQGW
jgi:hypothetical protein